MAATKPRKDDDVEVVGVETLQVDPETNVSLYKPETFGKEAMQKPVFPADEVEDKKPKKMKEGRYTMLATVKHDGVLYKSGDAFQLDEAQATLFKQKGWIK